MKTKKSVYLDTTIISYLFDDRPELQPYVAISKEWWDTQKQHFDIFASGETIAELKRGHYPRQQKALRFAEEITLLPRVDDVEKIAEVYVKRLLMPNDDAK